MAGSIFEMCGLVQVAVKDFEVDRYGVKTDMQIIVRLGISIAVGFRSQSAVYMALKGPEL